MTETHETYEVIVVGGGTAGMTAAKQVAKAGRRVLLVERDRTGGECLTTGCVPSKALLASARRMHDVRTARAFGIEAGAPSADWSEIRARIARIIEEIGVVDSPEALERSGVSVLHGEARFTGAREITVGERRYRGEAVVIATGSRPKVPAIPGLTESGYVTHVDVFGMPRMPRRLAVIGGGPTGLELGQAFARLGSTVTILERSERILGVASRQTSATLRNALEAEGITILCSTEAVRVERHGEERRVFVQTPDGEEPLEVDEILVAAGRESATDGLDLAVAGIEVGRRGIVVNDSLQTSADRVWACGDVIGPPYLTHAAEDQGRTVAKNVLGGRSRWDDRALPWGVYTDPEVGGVGLTEEAARAAHGPGLEVLRLPYSAIDRAVTDGVGDGSITVLLTPGWDRGVLGGQVVGAVAVGDRAAEVVQQFAFTMAWRLPAGLLAKTVQAYPTFTLGGRMAIGLHWRAKSQDDGGSTAARAWSRVRAVAQSAASTLTGRGA